MTQGSTEARAKKRTLPLASVDLQKSPSDGESGIRVATGALEKGILARHPMDGFKMADPYPMGPSTLRALRALIVALCPTLPAPQPADLLERVEQGARRFMAYMNPAVAWLMCVCIRILDLLPLVLLQAPRRLVRLSPEQARRFITQLSHTRFSLVRTVLAGLRGLVLSVYFDQSEVHAQMGYAPVRFIRERLALRRSLLEATEGG
jgi:hypothetical protein